MVKGSNNIIHSPFDPTVCIACAAPGSLRMMTPLLSVEKGPLYFSSKFAKLGKVLST